MFILTLAIFIFILGLLIFVHEFGHFVTAKKAGLRVDEFGFGLPPRAIGFILSSEERKGMKKYRFFFGQPPQNKEFQEQTIYSLNWIPLGGFVKIFGEEGEGKEDKRSFTHQKPGKRALILFAGVTMNVILAAVLIILGFFIGLPQEITAENEIYARDVKIQVIEIAANSPAQLAGLKVGDAIVKISGAGSGDHAPPFAPRAESFVEVAKPGDSVWKLAERQMEVQGYFSGLNGTMEEIAARKTYLTDWAKDRVARDPGKFGLTDPDKLDVGREIDFSEIIEDMDATLRIVKISKTGSNENGSGKRDYAVPLKIEDVQNFTKNHLGKTLSLEVLRGKETVELAVLARKDAPAEEGAMGIAMARTGIISYPWYQNIWEGLKATVLLLLNIILAFYYIIKNLVVSGQVIGTLTGPVGIFSVVGDATRLGFIYLLQFTALISLNLAVINALPFPALDGGRVLFVLIEKIKGSPVNQKVEQIIHNVGFALLLVLIILVTFRDIKKFF